MVKENNFDTKIDDRYIDQVTNEYFDRIEQENMIVENITKSDNVNHPSHYQGKIEVIDFIEDKELGFHLGNAIKYISRAGKKNKDTKIEDLRKAIWYIERYIEKYSKDGGSNG